MTNKLKKWEKSYKLVGNYAIGVLLIEMGKIIKRNPKSVYCMLDFLDMQRDFQEDKITVEEYSQFIVNEIKYLKK